MSIDIAARRSRIKVIRSHVHTISSESSSLVGTPRCLTRECSNILNA